MATIRRALVLATAEQHLGMITNFALLAAMSRLLTPGEIGHAVIGASVMAGALSIRQFVTPEVLIQRGEVSDKDLQTCFTLLFAATSAISVAILALASTIAAFYGEAGLTAYLWIAAIAALFEPVALPIITLLRKEMSFASIALINTSSGMVNAAVAIVFGLLGFSFLSFAWGGLAGTLVTVVLCLALRPQFTIYRLSLHGWRHVLRFGGYTGITSAMDKAYEALPQLLIARILPVASVGLYNRTNTICAIPDRVILGGVFSVAFPALAAEVRAGTCLAPTYLRSLSFITVFHWPGLIVLFLLADPVVRAVLGEQWLEIVPLVRIVCIASLFWFPVVLTQPLLVALGEMKENLRVSLISRPVSAVILCGASFFGLTALAASQLLSLPIQMMVSLVFVRRHARFEWLDLLDALRPSLLVTLASGAGPLVVVALAGFDWDLGVAGTVAAVALAFAGWLAGVRLSGHPLWQEFGITVATGRTAVAALRALGLPPAPQISSKPIGPAGRGGAPGT